MKKNNYPENKIDTFARQLGACKDALDFIKNKSWKTVFDTCPRGDWLLWFFQRTNPEHHRELVLASANCANTVKRLMKDKRSTDYIKALIQYGREICN